MLKQWLAKILTPLVEFFFSLVMAVPLGAVRMLFVLLLLFIALWLFSLPRQIAGDSRKVWWNDLRYFALLVVALQIVLYVIF